MIASTANSPDTLAASCWVPGAAFISPRLSPSGAAHLEMGWAQAAFGKCRKTGWPSLLPPFIPQPRPASQPGHHLAQRLCSPSSIPRSGLYPIYALLSTASDSSGTPSASRHHVLELTSSSVPPTFPLFRAASQIVGTHAQQAPLPLASLTCCLPQRRSYGEAP